MLLAMMAMVAMVAMMVAVLTAFQWFSGILIGRRRSMVFATGRFIGIAGHWKS